MKTNKELKAEIGALLEMPVWGALLLLLVVFGCGGMFALTTQAAVSARPTPSANATPTAVVQFITATPSPAPSPTPFYPLIVEENLRDNPIYGIGHEMQVRANWRITAVGVAYLADSGEWVERVYCDPMPADYLCKFPRPPLNGATMESFNIMVRETNESAAVAAGQWHYLKANASKDVILVEWGIEGNVYRYWTDSHWE
jgi:hypothetical protein